MSALWEPQYRGQILLYEGSAHNFSITALLAGIKHPFSLSDKDYRIVVDKLVALRANRPLFYSSPEEATDLFTKDDIALVYGNYGTQQVKALREKGADIGYIIPKEGALAWLDCWAVLAGNKDANLAQSWINYMISKPVSHLLTVRQGLANTVEASAASKEQDKLVWLERVEDPEKRAQFWQRILSGYRNGMF